FEQIVGVGVVVGRELDRDALVHRATRQPVELGARHLEQRDAGTDGEPQRLAYAVVAVDPTGDVERLGRRARPRRLHDRVAPDDPLRLVAGWPVVGTPPPGLGPLLGPGLAIGLVPRPVLGARRRPFALEAATASPARTRCRIAAR